MTKKKIISDSIFIYAGSLIKNLRGLIFLPLVIGAIGVADYGAFVQIIINTQIISPLCTMALGMGFLRYTSQYEKHETVKISRDYWTIMAASTAFALLGAMMIYLISPLISSHVLSGKYLNALRLSSLLVISNVTWTQNNKFLKSQKRFKLFTIFDLLYNLCPYLGFVAGLIMAGNLFSGLLVYVIFKLGLSAFVFISNAGRLKIIFPSMHVFKKFIKYSWALSLSEISGGLLAKADRYFIGYFMGPAAIGVYNIVYSVLSLISELNRPFNNYFSVYMPGVWDRGNIKRVKGQLKEGVICYLSAGTILLVILSFYTEPLLMFFLGKKFPGIENFNLLMTVTGAGIMAYGITGIQAVIIRCSNRNHYSLLFQAAALMVNMLLNLLLIPAYGVTGAGAATFVSYIMLAGLNNYFFSIDINRLFVIKLMKPVFCGLAVALLFMNLTADNPSQLARNIMAGLLLYAFLIFITGAIPLYELKKRFT